MLQVLDFGDEVVIERQVLQIMQTVKIFNLLDLIMLQVQHSQLLEHFQILNPLNIQPLQMNRLEFQHHGNFLFLRQSIGHAIIQRSLGDQINTNLVLLIQPLVAVLFGLRDFLLLDCLGFEVVVLRGRVVGFHLK